MPRPLGVDIDHLGESTLIRKNDMNLDSHPDPQGDAGQDQRTMTADDDGLAVTGQKLSKTLSLDLNLHANPRASSGFMSTRFGGHYASAFASLRNTFFQ